MANINESIINKPHGTVRTRHALSQQLLKPHKPKNAIPLLSGLAYTVCTLIILIILNEYYEKTISPPSFNDNGTTQRTNYL